MSGIISETIQKFITDTSPSQHIDNKIKTEKKRHKKSSRFITYKGSHPVNSETIINEKGIGKVRELAIISEQKINPYLEIDGENTLQSINSWDELAQVTLYTTTVIAQTNGTDFILSFNNLNFMNNIFLRVDFEPKGTIKRVIGVIDFCEEY